MGLCYATSRWLDMLWTSHLQISSPARDLVRSGINKQGSTFAGFPADLHARLYLPSNPPPQSEPPAWATHLHSLASELGEWQRLRNMCARNGFAAGVAAEVMLSHLLPHVPDPPPPQQGDSDGDGGGDGAPASDEPGSTSTSSASPTSPSNTPSPSTASENQSSPPSNSTLRAALRRASRAARDAVQEAESGLEGLGTPLGFSMPGTAAVASTGPANLKGIRDAHSRLHDSRRLKRICELAGRLERIAATKARSKVKPGVGEVHGIDLGDDLARLLPSELVALRHPRLRLHLLSRVLQKKALVYGMKGKEPQGRGPIVVLLDESGSMREGGKDVWSKAVALALMSTATRQKRDWYLVTFNGYIRRETTIPARQATMSIIQEALDHRCAGGTNFDRPVLKAIEIIETSRSMKRADVVIITDGESDLEPKTIEAATLLTKNEGVSWFAVGVGPDADTELSSLAPIATSMVRIRDTDDAEPIVPVINLSRQ